MDEYSDNEKKKYEIEILKKELKSAKMLLWAAIKSNGGELYIYFEYLKEVDAENIITRTEDYDNLRMIYKVK